MHTKLLHYKPQPIYYIVSTQMTSRVARRIVPPCEWNSCHSVPTPSHVWFRGPQQISGECTSTATNAYDMLSIPALVITGETHSVSRISRATFPTCHRQWRFDRTHYSLCSILHFHRTVSYRPAATTATAHCSELLQKSASEPVATKPCLRRRRATSAPQVLGLAVRWALSRRAACRTNQTKKYFSTQVRLIRSITGSASGIDTFITVYPATFQHLRPRLLPNRITVLPTSDDHSTNQAMPSCFQGTGLSNGFLTQTETRHRCYLKTRLHCCGKMYKPLAQTGIPTPS